MPDILGRLQAIEDTSIQNSKKVNEARYYLQELANGFGLFNSSSILLDSNLPDGIRTSVERKDDW